MTSAGPRTALAVRSPAEDLLLRLPAVLVPIVYSFLPPSFKLLHLSHLSHAHVALLTPSCFQQDHLILTPHTLSHLLSSSSSSSLSTSHRPSLQPLPPHLLLSTVPSLTLLPSPDSHLSTQPDLPLHLNPPSPSPSSRSPSLSPTPLFPSLTTYSQQVSTRGFQSPSLLSTHTHLTTLHIDTVKYHLDATFDLSPSLTSLHTLSLRALLCLAHIDRVLSLPSLTTLDLTGSSVIKAPAEDDDAAGAAGHGLFQSDSLVASAHAGEALPRLVHLSLPVGEQRLPDLVVLLHATAPHRLQSLRVDESPVTADCLRSVMRLHSLTSLELHTHTIHWDASPWEALSDAALPVPQGLRRLCFLGDHDSRVSRRATDELQQSVASLLSSFAHLLELELSVPTSVPLPLILPALLRMRRLQLLALSRGYGGWRPAHSGDGPPAEQLDQEDLGELKVATFSFLDDLSPLSMATLFGCAPGLTSLHLTHCDRLGLETLLAIGHCCPQLQELSFSYCMDLHLTEEGWAAAQDALSLLLPSGRVVVAPFQRLKALHIDLPHPSTTVVDERGLQLLVELLARSPLSVLSLTSPLLSPQLLLLSALPHLSSLGSTFSHSLATLASALYHSPAHTYRVFQRGHGRGGHPAWGYVFWEGQGEDGLTGRERFFAELRRRLQRGEVDEPVKPKSSTGAVKREQRSAAAADKRRCCCSRCAVM